MSQFKISTGQSVNIPITYEEGHVYFTQDDGKIYIDTSNEQSGRVLVNAGAADKLTTSNGSTIQPVFFQNGVPVSINFTIESSVPKDAKFTDTTYDIVTIDKDGLMSSADKRRLDNLVEKTYDIVTTNKAGLMSPEDKIKLDSLSERTGVLTFGKYTYDGTKDVHVDIFQGDTIQTQEDKI